MREVARIAAPGLHGPNRREQERERLETDVEALRTVLETLSTRAAANPEMTAAELFEGVEVPRRREPNEEMRGRE